MIDSKNVIYKLAAALLIIIGLAAVISAWQGTSCGSAQDGARKS